MKFSTRPNIVRLCRPRSFAASLAAISLATTVVADAALLITRAEAGQKYETSLSGASVLTFDESAFSGSSASNYTWNALNPLVGTIDQISILASDQWGGAGTSGSRYATQIGVATTTLTFNAPIAYFGMWWSAGDDHNQLTFYNGSTLVANFTTSTLTTAMPKSGSTGFYYGNPRDTSQNTPQIYAFINYFGMDGTTWNKIVFSNNESTSNFESDNWTVRKTAWGGPGTTGETGFPPGTKITEVATPIVTVIPEPSTLLATLVSVGFFVLRRKR